MHHPNLSCFAKASLPIHRLTNYPQNNFLMHSILALAARHLHEHSPQTHSPHLLHRDHETREAHHLQKALSSLSSAFNHSIHLNQDAVLATSFLLLFYVSSATILDPAPMRSCEDASFTFLHGIQSIVANGPLLAHNGRYKALVAPPSYDPVPPHIDTGTAPGFRSAQLVNSLPAGSPHLHNRDMYIERFNSLVPHIVSFTAPRHSNACNEVDLEIRLVLLLQWQALSPAAFVRLVQVEDPIALVIMAHYHAGVESVLSQAGDRWWWVRRKPRCMVRRIEERIGSVWGAWLEWPRSVLRG